MELGSFDYSSSGNVFALDSVGQKISKVLRGLVIDDLIHRR